VFVEFLAASIYLPRFKYLRGTTSGSLNATKIYPFLFIVLMSIDSGRFFFTSCVWVSFTLVGVPE